MQAAGAKVCVGGYLEYREMYRRSALFDGTAEPRNLHLGIDIWHAHAGVEVYAVLPGKIHSFANNAGFGNYGPTIILEHNLQELTFYTLYGHLSLASLAGLRKGDSVQGGQRIAWLGEEAENGNWPPHLHFQCMTNMLGMEGDFPGVCASGEREKYAAICFNPNYFLKIPALM
jgi:murein DD-endopeptidase MepM/ murein hydrolase activator NlpD